MTRVHDGACHCAECRHERFNPGPPTNPRRVNYYGHFKQGAVRKRTRQARLDERYSSLRGENG